MSSEKHDLPEKQPLAQRNSKINIKQLCNKFENLTSSNVHENNAEVDNKITESGNTCSFQQQTEGSFTPVPPLRKNRKANAPILRDTKSLMVKMDSSFEKLPEVSEKGSRFSVLEQAKLFEPDSNSVPALPKFKLGKPNFVPLPPEKPPRKDSNPNLVQKAETSLTCDSKSTNITFSDQKEGSISDVASASLQHLGPSPKLDSTAKTEEFSTPKKSKLRPGHKITKVTVLNYFKNLSVAANHLREKVKSKQSNIFVDLTPTTVTPPKEYGTLKRSHSDEHIYAEPYEPKIYATPSEVKGLHYMCTDITNEAKNSNVNSSHTPVPQSNKKLPSKSKLSRTSVRNVIYESFSSLREAAHIDSAKSQDENNLNGDSESDVSAKDIQERIIYVQSVKKQTSLSSICVAPKLFELVLIINISSENGPEVVFKYPDKPKKGYDYPLIPHLCFPDYSSLDKAAVYRSETFLFNLPNNEDVKILGYCHRILGWPEQSTGFCTKFPVAICLLSDICAPLFYNKILSEIEKHLVLPKKTCLEYLKNLQKMGVPNAGASLSIIDYTANDSNHNKIIARPLDCQTFGINSTKVLQLLDIDILLKALSSLLLERRILLLSSCSSNLLHCCRALSSLLYPFQWQHTLIPILPSCLLVQCCMESPYLLGVLCSDHTAILDLLGEQNLLIIDVDKGHIVKSCNDETTILPKKIQKAMILALSLAKNMTDPTEMMRDVMISEAVMHLFVEVVGHCQNHLVPQGDTFCFQKEAFQKSAPSRGIQLFLEWFSETQMFEAFIEEFIWRVKYRDICQSTQKTIFEKRIEEYKWELAYANDGLSKKIGKTVRHIGEKLKNLKKS